MTYQAILIASLFLLAAFGIEWISRILRIPAVIVMIAAGFFSKPLLSSLGHSLDGLEVAVPIVGTVGLVLIVLDGALDIRLHRGRLAATTGAIAMAVGGLVSCAALIATAAVLALPLNFFQATILAIPFAVISSAVAIPSSHFLPVHGREFVVYESSVSDILGVLVFFALLNSDGSFGSVVRSLLGGGVLSLLLAVVCSVGLVLVLMRFDGHVRFIPLLAALFGLYAAGKLLHLSPLILVLLFGLTLNNPKLITRLRPLRGWMDDSYEATLSDFKVLVLELTFAVRGFFFILLGYWTDISDLATPHAWIAAGLVLSAAYAGRYAMLKLGRHSLANSLTWIAPRGLITVLLFLSARDALPLPSYLSGTVVIVILISAALVAIAHLHGHDSDEISGETSVPEASDSVKSPKIKGASNS